MDPIEKLLRKVKKEDRIRLMMVLESIRDGKLEDLHVKRLSNSSFYRVRVGDFRIIFSIDDVHKRIFIESVSMRNENTYK